MIPQLLCMLAGLSSSTIQVSGGPGATQRLQDAIDACPAEGCVLELPDPAYPLTNMLWIEGKNDLRIVGTGATRPVLAWDDSLLVADTAKIAALFRRAPPSGGGRPKLPKGWLMWPYAYKSGVGTASDSSVTFSTTGYQHNGMVMIKNSNRIVLEGLTLDGRKSAAFRNTNVWDGQYDLFFGSLGVSLLRSLAVDIRDCEILHFWSGVYINDRNPSCQAWTTSKSDTGAKPWTACGTMGGHLIERNRIHANWWAFYSEGEWDQGSTIRENLTWDNADQAIRTPSETVAPAPIVGFLRFDEIGGFLFAKDDLMPVHVFSHNTIYASTSPFVYDQYRLTGTALWSDNIVHMLDSLGSESTAYFSYNALDDQVASGNHVWNNTILSDSKSGILSDTASAGRIVDSALHYSGPSRVPVDTIPILKGGQIVDSIVYATVMVDKNCASGCNANLVTPLQYQYFYWVPWGLRYGETEFREAAVKGPDSLIHTERVYSANFADSAAQASYNGQDSATSRRHANWVCRFCPFASLDPKSVDFLVPDSSSRLVKASLLERDTVGGHRGAVGADGKLGTQVPVRLRARGMPQLVGSTLRLPVSITAENAKLDGMAVRRVQVSTRGQDQAGYCFIAETVKDVNLSSIQPFRPTDTVISIAMSPDMSDVYQIDLWPVGVSGSDTLAGTPVSWAWTYGANAGTFRTPTTGVARAKTPVRIRLVSGPGGKSLLIQGYDGEFLALVDAMGRTHRVTTQAAPQGRTAQLEGIHSGIWFARLPNGSQRLLIAP